MRLIRGLTLLFATSTLGFEADEQTVLSGEGQGGPAPLNVAIIGAGAAGSSTAYHLSRYAAASDIAVNITVFERNDYVGGRTTTVHAYGDPRHPVELGGSVFVKVNRILMDAVNEFNLSTSSMIAVTDDIPGATLGVWDGEKFVVTQDTDKLTWWDTAKFLWRYGLAPVRTMNLMKETVGKFLKMYDEPHFPFASMRQAVVDLGLLGATSSTGENYVRSNSITGAFPHDIIQASTRVNYAQNLKYINGLLSMVCMATDGTVSVEGGNWQIFDNMVSVSNAHRMLRTNVTSIKKGHSRSYNLVYNSLTADDENQSKTDAFDIVVLTGPYQYSGISLPEDVEYIPEVIEYVQLHVTLLTSPHLLSPSYFNMRSGEAAPTTVLTTLPLNEEPREGPAGVGSPGFFSISLLSTIINPETDKQEYLYKIFSPEPPNSTFLAALLDVEVSQHDENHSLDAPDISWIHRKVWHSYPYEIPRSMFEHVQLDGNLWYTGGMDSFISTMETNSLMGRNVARLVVDQWMKKHAAIAEEYPGSPPSLLAGNGAA